MALTVALIFKKKNKSAPDLNLELLSTKDTLHTKNDNISWITLDKRMLYYLLSIITEVYEIELDKKDHELIELSQDDINKFLEIVSFGYKFFLEEFILAYSEFERYSTYLLIMDNQNIMDSIPEYDIKKYDFADSFMLIESLEGDTDLTYNEALKLLIDKTK